ncbi:hypothetical protein AZ19_2441 [Bordetella bronchiseptica E012]|uniref:N-acetyltransferase YedL n=3 Tax=Bordetella bronchiseptica TaxID=518 RepID=A0ABR4REP7_BORBO|nr:hypothetical protein [Bordetella bronchiseptica]KCV34700.1 hypothetical protein L490_2209 [Bordetella bronchiseptica 00-P-2796]KDC01941.1 hypothetical protein AZ18_2532 [Bordetella bronchiseptica D993]KDC07506.1 hypothetical protein AZ24_2370 [Bordetella bronchiseptica E013]KDC08429.1 hypothetical protein AZ19_2441 [Bordetella bronchiseptica E012]KDD32748.1 hypothetical protein L527_2440 [Bordetella bronchiseptica MBORD839]KDD63651.1 hypothetical protein L536_2315 [Bordetella bronchiseptic
MPTSLPARAYALPLILPLILPLLLAACSDAVQTQYRDLDEARAAGAIQRGWLPAWLPARTGAIAEAHDLDTNRRAARFVLPDGARIEPPGCAPASGRLPPPALALPGWPASLHQDGAAGRYRLYRCADGYAAFDASHGYLWN